MVNVIRIIQRGEGLDQIKSLNLKYYYNSSPRTLRVPCHEPSVTPTLHKLLLVSDNVDWDVKSV